MKRKRPEESSKLQGESMNEPIDVEKDIQKNKDGDTGRHSHK